MSLKKLAVILEGYDYSCLMLSAPPDLQDEIAKLQNMFEPEDLTDKGIEHDHHITLLFGIHSDVPEKAFDLVPSNKIRFKLGVVGLFHGEKCDVVKMDIESPEMLALHDILVGGLDATETHDYHPHLTLAYVKPGEGTKYVSMLTGLVPADKWYESDALDFSNPAGEHTTKVL